MSTTRAGPKLPPMPVILDGKRNARSSVNVLESRHTRARTRSTIDNP